MRLKFWSENHLLLDGWGKSVPTRQRLTSNINLTGYDKAIRRWVLMKYVPTGGYV
jgi:hypothetical protein